MHPTGELRTSRSWRVPITFFTVSYCFFIVAQINVHDPSGNVKIRDNASELIKLGPWGEYRKVAFRDNRPGAGE